MSDRPGVWNTPDDPWVEPFEQTWGIRREAVMGGLFVTCAAGLWGLLDSAPEDRLVAAAVFVVLGTATLAGWFLRRRLTVNQHGLTLRSIAGARHVGWSQVTGLNANVNRRRGIRSVVLEIDLSDDGLLVLGALELGTDPESVADVLRKHRPAH